MHVAMYKHMQMGWNQKLAVMFCLLKECQLAEHSQALQVETKVKPPRMALTVTASMHEHFCPSTGHSQLSSCPA